MEQISLPKSHNRNHLNPRRLLSRPARKKGSAAWRLPMTIISWLWFMAWRRGTAAGVWLASSPLESNWKYTAACLWICMYAMSIYMSKWRHRPTRPTPPSVAGYQSFSLCTPTSDSWVSWKNVNGWALEHRNYIWGSRASCARTILYYSACCAWQRLWEHHLGSRRNPHSMQKLLYISFTHFPQELLKTQTKWYTSK